MKNGQDLRNSLAGYGGGETIYRHSLASSFNYTEGVREFAREAGQGAYWLLDILATEPAITNLVNEERFALVILMVAGSKAVLTVDDGNGSTPVFTLDIEYTDCPEGAWKFYIEAGYVGGKSVRVCMLPQER